jgi:hypothetical protein
MKAAMEKWLIDDWKHGWKFYSTWLAELVAALPSLYDALAAAGYLGGESPLPDSLKWVIRAIGIAAICVRFIKQKKPDEPTEKPA